MADLYDGMEEAASTLSLARGAGIKPDKWARFRKDPAFRERVAKFMNEGAFSDPFLSERGYEQYAPPLHVFGPLEWQTFFNVALSVRQWEVANAFPWTGEHYLPKQNCPFDPDLELMRTHFAFLSLDAIFVRSPGGSYPLTLGNLEALVSESHWPNRPRVILRDETYQQEQAELRWFLVPMGVVPAKRFKLLPHGYELPRAIDFLLANILYYQKYSAWMVDGDWSAETGDGDHSPVQFLEKAGEMLILDVEETHKQGYRDRPASRKLPQ